MKASRTSLLRARLIAAAVVPLLLAVTCALLPPASNPAFAGPASTGLRTSHAGPRLLRRAADNVFELPPDNVVQAVAKAGPKVTVADVAAAGGISLDKAKKGLVQLASAIKEGANLEVSQSGELVYVFPSDPQAALSAASSAAAAREAWENAKPADFTALRVLFGVALFASIAIIYSAIFILSTSSSSDRDRDDRRGGYDNDGYGSGGGGFGGGFGFGGPTLYFGPSPFDLFFYRPYYTYDTRYEYYVEEQKPKMGLLESVYSLVFGDGDPNYGREEKQLAAVASLARKNGGVLTAEQLAPILDPPVGPQKSREAINVDESWVLSSLTRLNGRPEVTPGGQIVYVFDDLQTTAASGREDLRRGAAEAKILEEKEVPFSMAEDDQLTLAGILGVVNLLGAGYLGLQFSSLPAGIALGGFLGFVKVAYPALVAYAVGFVGAPALRYFGLDKKNAEIEERNRLRREWRNTLESGQADGKLAEARTYRTAMRQVGDGDSVYSTAKGAAEQASSNDMADFDRRMGSKA